LRCRHSKLGDHGLASSWRNISSAAAPASRRSRRAGFESGYIKQAGTIEELAKLIKVDRAALKATVDRWNSFVVKGVDEDFHRGEPRL